MVNVGAWLRTLKPGFRVGAASGAIATCLMTAPMLWARRTGRVDAIGPEHITDAAFHFLGTEPSRRQHLAATAVAHAGYGSAAGAAFAVAGSGRSRLWSGLAYGTGIALAGYQGWVPAMGILPALTRAGHGRRFEVISSHVVYGAALVAVSNGLRARD